MLSAHVIIQRFESVRLAAQIEIRRHEGSAGRAEALPSIRVRRQFQDRLRQGFVVRLGNQESRFPFLHGLRDTAAPRSDDGEAYRLGLQENHSQTFSIANWLDSRSAPGQLRSASHGSTRTLALWAQGAVKLTPSLGLTLGGRYEWWRAYDGLNSTLSTAVNASLAQPERRFGGFSPKASLEWKDGRGFSVRLSAGQAWRMPTVGELYQTTSVGTLLANPNPGLLPERARSLELSLAREDANGLFRISLFNEVIDNALISQLNPTSNATFVQNVDRTRARGVELVADRRNVLPRLDLAFSLTYADAITSKDTVFPAAVGKLLPSVPHWKGSAVVTWRATPKLTLTTAARFASRNYANLANDDTVGQTYQGFYKYFVVDMRAAYKLSEHIELAVGVDNIGNDKYFLFHPFPQRSFTAQVNWKL